MDNKQARKTGRTIIVCGCIFIVLSKLWLGLAFIAVGLGFMAILGRCPHCGRQLLIRKMMVTDDDVYPTLRRHLNLLYRLDAAVHGDNQGERVGSRPFDSLG